MLESPKKTVGPNVSTTFRWKPYDGGCDVSAVQDLLDRISHAPSLTLQRRCAGRP
jgi:hypothetical protein